MTLKVTHHQPSVSVAIFAWNEERTIVSCLSSLLEQTLFSELARGGQMAEIVCVVNGCTDSTARVARTFLSERLPSGSDTVAWRVEEITERGKLNAWNKYVHELSDRSSEFMILMDADIVMHERRTLWNMVEALKSHPEASISVDRPRKDLEFKKRRGPLEALSMRASSITHSADAQLCAQLYCVRSEVARRIYLPRDLAACEDGFIKALVCTDFLEAPVNPRRIVLAENAEHVFEAYTSPRSLLKNQKRQVIGQTMVHLLIDHELPKMSRAERSDLAAALRKRDESDPSWLKRLLSQHLSRTRRFWRVCPTYVGTPIRRWTRLGWKERFFKFPAVACSTGLGFAGSYLAWRALKAGCTDYWPRAERATTSPPLGAPVAVPVHGKN